MSGFWGREEVPASISLYCYKIESLNAKLVTRSVFFYSFCVLKIQQQWLKAQSWAQMKFAYKNILASFNSD